MTTTLGYASRAAAIPPSPVHAIYREVNEWQRRTGRTAARLDVGEPHLPPPPAAIEALGAAVRAGHTGYTSAEGLLELRAALVDKLRRVDGHDTDVDRVYVCAGAAQGLTALVTALADPGDEILLPAWHWPIHFQQSVLAGVRPVCYPVGPDLCPDPEVLRSLATDRTRVLLINTPNNPTGATYDEHLLAKLLDLARERDWQVISDEAYEDFVYEGSHVSTASLEAGLPPEERRVSSVYTFSKNHSMTGFRLGYTVTPDAARGRVYQVVQEASILSSPTPVQYAGLAALSETASLERHFESVRRSRDALAPLVDAGLVPRLPDGGWFCLLDLAAATGEPIPARRFAADLLDAHAVAVAPAEGFALRAERARDGGIGHIGSDPGAASTVRVAFCGAPHVVGEASERIAEFARDYEPGRCR